MNPRNVIRHAAPPIGVILAALAVAAAILLIARAGIAGEAASGGAGAVQPTADVVAVPAAVPAADHQPPTGRRADDVRELWRRGEYVAAGVLGLFLLLAAAARVDRRRALYYTAGLTAMAGCVDIVANGETPSSGMLIGAVAVFVAIIQRSPLPEVAAQPRQSERGSAVAIVMASLAIGALGTLCLWSCGQARRTTAAVKDAVIECSKLAADAHAAEYADRIERAILAGTEPNGEVAWAAAKREIAAILADAGAEVAGCAAVTALARLLYPSAARGIVPTPEPSPAKLRDGWDQIQRDMLGGRRYRVEMGAF